MLIQNARYCYVKAFAARERALEAKQPEDRLLYFECEARWLKLAQHYEISASTGQLVTKATDG